MEAYHKSLEKNDESIGELFEIRKIVKHRGSGRNKQYYVQWWVPEGYEGSQFSWELASSLEQSYINSSLDEDHPIEEYEQCRKKKRTKKDTVKSTKNGSKEKKDKSTEKKVKPKKEKTSKSVEKKAKCIEKKTKSTEKNVKLNKSKEKTKLLEKKTKPKEKKKRTPKWTYCL